MTALARGMNATEVRYGVRRFTDYRSDRRCFELYDIQTGECASFPGTRRDLERYAKDHNKKQGGHEMITTGKHTPGPWKLAEAVGGKISTSMRRIRSEREGTDHGAVCEVYGIKDGTEAASNASLIVASPDMLSLLEEAVGVHDRQQWVKRAEEVIAKAKG